MRKLLILIILAGIVAAVGVKFVFKETERKAGRGNNVAVETATIGVASLGDTVVFTGTILAEERYDAAPKIAGIIQSVNFNVGDRVRKGDVLAVLDDDELRLEVEQRRASLNVAQATANDAKAQLDIARRDYDRVDALRRERVISAQEFDRTDASLKAKEALYETALANVKLSEATLRTAEVRLGYTRVTADWDAGPVERVIGQRFLDAGALVPANTPILSVLDIEQVRALISVSEKRYPRISRGDRVTVFTDAFPGRAYAGKVSRIPQELGELTRTAEIEVLIGNADHTLKPGMFVRADIEFQRRERAVAAPLAAVVRRDDGSRGVYVVEREGEENKVSFHPVTEGIVDGNFVELVNAPDMLGREVVTLGQHLLKDGITVRVANASSASGEETAGGA